MNPEELKALEGDEEKWLEWKRFYKDMDFDLWIRFNCDVFLRDGKWGDIQKLSKSDPVKAASFAEQQYLSLLRQCDECLMRIGNPEKRQSARTTIFQNLQERYKDCPMQLVDTVVRCISKEEEIKWRLSNTHVLYSQDGDVVMAEQIMDTPCTSRTSGESLPLKISRLKGKSQLVSENLKKLEGAQLNYKTDMPFILGCNQDSRVSSTQTDESHETGGDIDHIKRKLISEVKTHREVLISGLEQCCQMVEDLFEPLLKEIASWKEKQKLAYLKLEDEPVEALKELAKWCSEVGKILLEVIKCLNSVGKSELWTAELVQFEADPGQPGRIAELDEKFRRKFAELCQSCFIETTQPFPILQVNSSKNMPGTSKPFPAKIRCLALEGFHLPNYPKVTAKLLSETELNGVVGTKSTTLELHNASVEMQRKPVGIHDWVVADFESLQVRKFKRPKRARKTTAAGVDQLFVCEQKFRLVFTSVLTVEGFLQQVPLKAVSLPITITTNSSQEGDCSASLLWQCWSTDVNNVDGPFIAPDSLPWDQVSTMLSKKFEVETGRALPRDQLEYLAEKLIGEACEDYSTLVISWAQFAKDKLRSTEFTFWRWFYAAMNLLKYHMKEEWRDWRIYGFISRKNAEKVLHGSSIGTFLLRISESTINESGPHITGSVAPVYVNTRKKSSQKTVKLCVSHIDPYTVEDLKIHKNLGNALKTTMMGEETAKCPLKWLYIASDQTPLPREDAFKHYKPPQEATRAAHEDAYSHYIGRTIHSKLDVWNYRQEDLEDDDDEESNLVEDNDAETRDGDSGTWSTGESATPQSEMSVVSPFPEPDSQITDHCYSTAPATGSKPPTTGSAKSVLLASLLKEPCSPVSTSLNINNVFTGSSVVVNSPPLPTSTFPPYRLQDNITPASSTASCQPTYSDLPMQTEANDGGQFSAISASPYREELSYNLTQLESTGNLPLLGGLGHDAELSVVDDDDINAMLSEVDLTGPSLANIESYDFPADDQPSMMQFLNADDESLGEFV